MRIATAQQRSESPAAQRGGDSHQGMVGQPHRVQLSRKKGWRMPPNTVKVSRPTKWGNPFKIGDDVPGMPGIKADREDVVHYFEIFLQIPLEEIQTELRGKNLACFCKLNEPCHADVLLRLANGQGEQPRSDK